MYQESKELIVTTTNHPCLTEWRRIVDEAESRGWFTIDDRYRARNWQLCAVGEARVKYRIPFYSNFEGPLDGQLMILGKNFNSYVRSNEFQKCRETIDAIELRLSELVCVNA